MSAATVVDLVVDARAELGEGPVWDEESGNVLWVDIVGRSIHRTDPTSRTDRVIGLPDEPGMVALDHAGAMVVALPSMIARVNGDGSVIPIASIPHDPSALRMNDGKVDAAGRLWVGSIGWRAEPGLARLYRVDPSGSVATLIDRLTISNGIGWSPDLRTMYHIETATRRVDAFDFDIGTAGISNRRSLIEFGVADGYPDGMAVDAVGGLWIAMWDGGCLRRHLPDGSPDRVISIGTPRPTSCVFGGPDLGTLFITSARVGLHPEVAGDTHAGGLFSIRTGVSGLPGHRFAG